MNDLPSHHPAYLTPDQVRDLGLSGWERALAAPLSDAARAARHDKRRSRHRPGGRVMPRSRWAPDEEPQIGGWDWRDPLP